MIFVQRRTVVETPELIENGQFSNSDDWSFIGTTVIEDGVAKFPDATTSFLIQSNVFPLTVTNYILKYNVISTNGNNFRLSGGNSAFGTVVLDSSTTGTKTVQLTSNGTKKNIQFNNNGFIGSIDNVSVKIADSEIPKQNNLYVTISERLNLTSNKWLLLVFESDQQHTKSKTVLNANSSDVTLNERIDKLKLTEGGNSTQTTDGTVKISVAGFWEYKIYEQTSATNLDETSSDIQQLLEVGKMTVTDTDELTTVEHTNQVTNFIHLNS
jgi:hypothetical protein